MGSNDITVLNLITGIAAALFAAFFAQMGLVIQKQRVNTLEKKAKATGIKKSYASDPIWVISIFMNVVLALVFNIVANGQVGVTIATPIFNGGIIFLVLGLVLICKEKLTMVNYLAVILLVIGLILTGLGDISGKPSVEILKSNISIFGIVMALVVVLGIIGFIIQLSSKKLMIYGLGLLAGCLMTLNLLMGQMIDLAIQAAVSKDLIWTIILIAIVVIFGSVGTVGNIMCNQKAFKNGSAIRYLPIVISIQNILPVLAGVFVLNQHINKLYFFLPGLILIIAGAIMLSSLQAENN